MITEHPASHIDRLILRHSRKQFEPQMNVRGLTADRCPSACLSSLDQDKRALTRMAGCVGGALLHMTAKGTDSSAPRLARGCAATLTLPCCVHRLTPQDGTDGADPSSPQLLNLSRLLPLQQ